jgi:diacylglycerol kinase family enzyme
MLVVGNTRTYAPGIVFTPDASPVDGLLDAVILPSPRIRDYVPWLRAVRQASRLSDPRIRYLRGRSFQTHETGIDWEVDGEYVGAHPLRISVLPRSLAIVLPRRERRAAAASA